MLEEPPKAAPKAPPMPCPDKPIRFLEESPVKPKPTVKRPPAGAKAPPRFDDQGQVVEQKPVGPPAATQEPPVPKHDVSSGGPTASSSSGGAAADTPEVVGGAPAPSDDYLRRQAFIRQEQMARSRAGLLLLSKGATYQEALESSIARELAEQRQAADAAALAKGPPPHLVGTEVGQPFGAQLGGQQLAPEVTTAPPARAAPSRPPPEVTTPAVATPPSSSAASSAPTSSTLTAAAPSASSAGIAAAAGQATSCAGVPPFPPVDRVGRAGYGTRNQSRRPPAPGLSAWDAFRFPLHEPGADLRHKEIPYSVEAWTADTWEEAERLEAAIASGASTPPQRVSAGVILRSLPSHVRGGRLPRERPADFTQWIGSAGQPPSGAAVPRPRPVPAAG